MRSSVSKKNIGPITQVIFSLVEVAAVVHAASPIHGLTVKVLLVERRSVLHLLEARRRGRHADRMSHSVVAFIVLDHVISDFVALSLHLLELIKPIFTNKE